MHVCLITNYLTFILYIGKTGNDVRCREDSEENSREEVARDKNEDIEMGVWSHKSEQNRSLMNWMDNENGRHIQANRGRGWYGHTIRREA